MSGLLTGAVLRHAPYRGRRLLVLIVLADAAGDTGRTSLAWEDMAPNARTTPRHFREEVDALIADGRVLRFRRPGHTNILQLRFPPEWGTLPPEVTGEKRQKRTNPAPKTKRATKRERSDPTPAADRADAPRASGAANADAAERQAADRCEADRLAAEIEAKWGARRGRPGASLVVQPVRKSTG